MTKAVYRRESLFGSRGIEAVMSEQRPGSRSRKHQPQAVGREWTSKRNGFKLEKPTSSDVLPPSRSHLLSHPKEYHLLETKHLYARDYRGHLIQTAVLSHLRKNVTSRLMSESWYCIFELWVDTAIFILRELEAAIGPTKQELFFPLYTYPFQWKDFRSKNKRNNVSLAKHGSPCL